jgi:hypothetical protein
LAPNHPDSTVAANASESAKMNGALIGAIAAAIAVLVLVLIVLIYMRGRKKSLTEPEAAEMMQLENNASDISQTVFHCDLNLLSQYQDDDLWIGEDEPPNGDSIFGDGFQESTIC